MPNKNYSPLISIVISVFNKRKYLPRLLESIINQTYSNFELILVDACSSDGSYEYLETISDYRLKLIKQPNLGLSVAKNYGVNISNGEFIAFIDADDYWEVDYFKEIVSLISKFPEHSAFITAYRRVLKSNHDNVYFNKSSSYGIVNDYFPKRLQGWGVHTSSVVMTRDIFNKAGGFPFLLGSRSNSKSWLIDCNGSILGEIDLFCLETGSITIDANFMPIPASLRKIDDLVVALPDVHAEDQFLHDNVATLSDYIYSSKILSNWDGNVKNQLSTKRNRPFIFSHIFSVCKVIKEDNKTIPINELKNYIKYLLIDFSLLSKNIEKKALKKYIKFHGLELLGIHNLYQLHMVAFITKVQIKFKTLISKLKFN